MDFAKLNFEVTTYGCVDFEYQMSDEYADVSVSVSFADGVEPKNGIEEHWQEIEAYLGWVDKQEQALKQILIDRGMLQEANEYVEDCLDFEERDGETVYLDQWEDEITLPIPKDDFLENTRLEDVYLRVGNDGTMTSEIFFGSSPEYFGGHSMDMSLDENREVTGISIQG